MKEQGRAEGIDVAQRIERKLLPSRYGLPAGLLTPEAAITKTAACAYTLARPSLITAKKQSG